MADLSEQLSRSLSESVLCLICFGSDRGQIAAGFVEPKQFEPPYDDIAARAIEYRHRYKQAPGRQHIDDLFDHVLSNQKSAQAPIYSRILLSLYKQSQSLNEEYVLNRLTEFARRQKYKGVVYSAGMRIQQGGDGVADDVEAILNEAWSFRVNTLDPGISGAGKDALSFLDQEDGDRMGVGIPELDHRGLVPTRKELHVMIAPRKGGKSFWCTHLSKMALLHGWRALDISLEMSQEKKMQRFIQSWFAVPKKAKAYSNTYMSLDELGRLDGFYREDIIPEIALQEPLVKMKLRNAMSEWGGQLDNYRTKSFPTGALTISKLKAHLDFLDQVHHFVPDLLIIDYPWLMAKDIRDPRMSYGRIIEELRGIGDERNMAIEVPHQANRGGESAKIIQAHHAAEDISIVATADLVLTYNATAEEKRKGLARLFVSNARNDEDRFTIFITQNYGTGQFVLQSAPDRGQDWHGLVAALPLENHIPEGTQEGELS
jgi:hypothetical protein